MEAMLNFIPAPVAIVLIIVGFVALAVGAIRMGYKQLVKDLAYDLVCKAEDSIMGSGQGAKKKAQVFAALRAACPAWLKPIITDEVLDAVIEKAVSLMKKALAEKAPTINKE
nr:MAG TPA: holin [Caudoviricetes sp.]